MQRISEEDARFYGIETKFDHMENGEHSVIHTIKYGPSVENDWFPSSELDKVTKHLDPYDLFVLG